MYHIEMQFELYGMVDNYYFCYVTVTVWKNW
ncbi:hypothetical protein SAMN05421747_106160 [Parapedobacter composti]|uniref:Uncharacterized protein n=1 Tax=Parapedobacter composti TaxID=623281 RepID=A0A1I1HNR5_9SPHI|nr:hypothetical protein SAMN05421747_106160 [Parapedobacter composti]